MIPHALTFCLLVAAASARNCDAPAEPNPADPKQDIFPLDPAGITYPDGSSPFGSSRQGGAITNYETGSFTQQHCLGNTNARKAFDISLPGGITSPTAKNAIATNKWVAVNDVNLGSFDKWSNCGMCVQVTAKLAQDGKPPISTTVGPLLIADRCSECPDAAIDLKSGAYKDLGIERGSVQPDQTDGGTTKMETSWHFVACGTPYKVIRE